MRNQPYKRNIHISKLRPDPEGAGLLDAPQMQIYDRIIMDAMKGSEHSGALQELKALPTEHRYLWRVVSALGFAFGDFDSACVRLDLGTLPETEIYRLANLIENRSIQFCILLREIFGVDQMKAMISAAATEAAKTGTASQTDQHRAA